MSKKIIKEVEEYYTGKLREFGATPKGVDWNGEESQSLRFEQLMKVVDVKKGFSLLDYGCGFGSLLEFLNGQGYENFNYFGYDIAESMVNKAKEKFKSDSYNFITTLKGLSEVDYIVASGIFNVQLENEDLSWKEYIMNTLQIMNKLCIKGFAFNVLTSYSDEEYMRDYLYYADPLELFHYCKQNFSKNVALLHDYGLYEFTIIIRKQL